jgi:hypothetical protein
MKLFNLGAKRCIHRHTIQDHPKCFDSSGNPKTANQPSSAKVLILDVETLPILGYSWGVWNQNIYPNQIEKDWCILSYSAKWLGDDRIISDVLTPKEALERNDKRIVSGFWKLLDEAFVTVSHNGKRFDLRKLNARFWKNGLHKPSSYKIIDTLTTARSVFGLTFNKMDFIAKFIGADEKLETEFELWRSCDRGDKSALQEMKEYNEQDVYTLEQIYLEMREWIPNHPDLGIYQNLVDVCPVCLDSNYRKIGLYTSNKKQYNEYRCSNCNSIWHDSKCIKGDK